MVVQRLAFICELNGAHSVLTCLLGQKRAQRVKMKHKMQLLMLQKVSKFLLSSPKYENNVNGSSGGTYGSCKQALFHISHLLQAVITVYLHRN